MYVVHVYPTSCNSSKYSPPRQYQRSRWRGSCGCSCCWPITITMAVSFSSMMTVVSIGPGAIIPPIYFNISENRKIYAYKSKWRKQGSKMTVWLEDSLNGDAWRQCSLQLLTTVGESLLMEAPRNNEASATTSGRTRKDKKSFIFACIWMTEKEVWWGKAESCFHHCFGFSSISIPCLVWTKKQRRWSPIRFIALAEFQNFEQSFNWSLISVW